MAYNNNNDDNRKAVYGIVVDPTPKRRKIDESIENTIIPDDVLHNILSRLSAKPLMRFRCASKHWNRLITDPHFMNSRSHRMILIPSERTHLYAFDPKHQNIAKLTYPFEHQIYKCSIIGTLNGIAVLVIEKTMVTPVIFILYNPLTRATKKLPDLRDPCCFIACSGYVFGFGHGNIIIAQACCTCSSTNRYNNCNVFSLKSGSWTTPKTTFAGGHQTFPEKLGKFLNGFLHWVMVRAYNRLEIVALDVTEMVVTRMDTPRLTIDCYKHRLYVLGVLNGCLCMSATWSHGFDVWVKEQKWSKQYSFVLPFYRHGCRNGLDVSILEDGRLLVKDEVSNQIIMCHLFERYYDIFKCASEIQVTSKVVLDKIGARCKVGKPFEYVESLVSPSDICHV